MEKITSAESLKARILILENRRSLEEAALKAEFGKLQEHLKPANLLKSAVKDLTRSLEFKGSLIDILLSWGGGFLSKKLVAGKHPGVFRSILGSLVELLVTAGLAKNADAIKTAVTSVIQNFFNKEAGEPDGPQGEKTE